MVTARFNVRADVNGQPGASGNGADDDLAAFTRTIAEAENHVAGASWARAAVIEIPMGVYGLSAAPAVRVPNIVIDADGPGNPTGSANPDVSSVYGGAILKPLPGFADPDWILRIGRDQQDYTLSGMAITGLGIDGYALGSNATAGGILWQAFKSRMSNVYVARVKGEGIYEEAIGHVTTWPKGAWDNSYETVRTHQTGGHGFHCSRGASDSSHRDCFHAYAGGHGMFLEGSGRQVKGCYVYNCTGNAINGVTRGQVITGGNRFVDCNGGVYLTGTGYDGGDFLIANNQLRSTSYDGDGLHDAIVIDPSSDIHGGMIGPNSFSTVQRNGPPNRMRYAINITNPHMIGATICPQTYGWVKPAVGCYAAAVPINDQGSGTLRRD